LGFRELGFRKGKKERYIHTERMGSKEHPIRGLAGAIELRRASVKGSTFSATRVS